MLEETLQDIANRLDDISGNLNPNNDFGSTVGDELNALNYHASRIADALEMIAKKMK